MAERHSVDSIKEGDFDVPEFKKIAQTVVERKPNPFDSSNTTSEPSGTTGMTEAIPSFAAVDEDECPF